MADCHWRFGLWDCTGMWSRSIVFEVVIDTIIRGWLFPSFLCITQVLTISHVRGSLCVRMLYDLGVLAFFVTLARSHVFRIGFRTRTVCCGDRGASSFAVRSSYDLYISCRCWRNAFTFPSDRDDLAGRFCLYLHPFRSSHGDGRLWSIGVVLRHNIAK